MPTASWELPAFWLWATILTGIAQPPTIRINVPAHRLELIDSGRVVRTYRVAIGDGTYPTPTGRFLVRRIVWRPSWVPPADEPWARDKRPEPPGPENPMGPVKLPLGGGYFIHGSPRSLRGTGTPTHGCIRLQDADAIALARYLTSAAGLPDRTDTLATATVALATAVPVDIRYALVEIRHGRVVFNPDPYHQRTSSTDSTDARLLVAAGYPGDSALTIVSRLLDSAHIHQVSVPLRRSRHI